jgi:hypothetical protein
MSSNWLGHRPHKAEISDHTRTLPYCKYCNEQIVQSPKSSFSKTKIKKFCNSSCFASYNNKLRKQKNPCTKCLDCETQIPIKNWFRRKYCNNCLVSKRAINRTILQMTHAKIRSHARRSTMDREQKCVNCGYDKFVETCHIKAVGDFEKNTTLAIVNDQSNLILLCPNCHWEFDHGILVINHESNL